MLVCLLFRTTIFCQVTIYNLAVYINLAFREISRHRILSLLFFPHGMWGQNCHICAMQHTIACPHNTVRDMRPRGHAPWRASAASALKHLCRPRGMALHHVLHCLGLPSFSLANLTFSSPSLLQQGSLAFVYCM